MALEDFVVPFLKAVMPSPPADALLLVVHRQTMRDGIMIVFSANSRDGASAELREHDLFHLGRLGLVHQRQQPLGFLRVNPPEEIRDRLEEVMEMCEQSEALSDV